jgi:hypothetical protein
VRPSHGGDEKFFGHDHYVEIKDQLYGRYGGLSKLRLVRDQLVEIGFEEQAPGLGSDISVSTKAPLSPAILSEIRALERGWHRDG